MGLCHILSAFLHESILFKKKKLYTLGPQFEVLYLRGFPHLTFIFNDPMLITLVSNFFSLEYTSTYPVECFGQTVLSVSINQVFRIKRVYRCQVLNLTGYKIGTISVFVCVCVYVCFVGE
jgi:hypothetical protein